MPKYTKRPVAVEARQFVTDNEADSANMNELVEWIVSNGGEASHNGTDITIKTLEGDRQATCGDYIIKGVKGEFYPCKHIFELTYRPDDESEYHDIFPLSANEPPALYAILVALYEAHVKHKWPTDVIHQAAIMAEEAGEVIKAANDMTYSGGSVEDVRRELAQTGAMCIRMLGSLGRAEVRPKVWETCDE